MAKQVSLSDEVYAELVRRKGALSASGYIASLWGREDLVEQSRSYYGRKDGALRVAAPSQSGVAAVRASDGREQRMRRVVAAAVRDGRLSHSVVRELSDSGVSQSDIAREFGLA